MSEKPSDAAEAAPGQLASVLLEAAILKKRSMPAPASSGLDEIDSAVLHGGFRYGEITSIAGASGIGKTLIALNALASHLVQQKNGDVAFIDSTGSFSPVRLRDVILTRLSKQIRPSTLQESGYMYEKVPHDAVARDEEPLTEKATAMLDRVRVMRVFDFAGVVEAIGEVNEICERRLKLDEEKKRRLSARSRKTTGEVLDSQDEDDEDDRDGDAANVETVDETINEAEGSGPATCEVRIGSLEGDTAAIGMIVLDRNTGTRFKEADAQ